ncbi:MAG: hypothetical protein R3195_10050 [Gemmatimonadota bacterium]|nr:hypothetical protein [Gemmatimonadota bacterium]
MSERRTARGLTVEALVIVVSILAAFTVDAWWDGRQESRRERAVLEGILDDFRQSKEDLEFKSGVAEWIATDSRAVLSRVRAAPEGSSIMASTRELAAVVGVPTYDANTATLDAAVSSGEIELVRSRAIREALSSWLRAYRDNAEDERAIRDLGHTSLFPALSEAARLGDVFDAALEPPEEGGPRTVRVDRRLEGLLALRVFYADFVRDGMADLGARQTALIGLIEEELAR